MSTPNSQKGKKIITAIAAIILFVMLAFGSVHLKTSGLVGDPAFVSLLIASGVFGLAAFFHERLKKFGASGFELHEAVREVKDAEASVKRLAASTLELIESNEGGYKQPSWDAARYEQAKEHLKRLL